MNQTVTVRLASSAATYGEYLRSLSGPG